MAKEQSVARKPSRSKGDTQKKPDAKAGRKGRDDGVSSRERELAGYLQKRIKPGLNSGAIPLLARSIAKEIAHQEAPSNGSQRGGADEEPKGGSDDKPKAQSDDKPKAQSDDQQKAQSDDEAKAQSDEEPKAGSGDEAGGEDEKAPDFEADMHDLQKELGEHWILRFSVQGDNAWLTAEMDDGSQRLEAPTAEVLADAVAMLNEAGGRSG